MSNLRFAPITSTLLARKGQAAPSQLFPPPPDSYWRPVTRTNGHLATETMPDEPADPTVTVSAKAAPYDDRPHKVRVALSDAELERFGLAAVKRGITRQQLLREAINDYVDRLMRDYENCGCITGVAAASGCCRG